MALSAKVGSFAAAATTGNQSITGVGFQPKAVIAWLDKTTADQHSAGAVSNAAMPMCFGMTDGTSACCWVDNDDFTAGNPYFHPSDFLRLSSGGAVLLLEATIVSLDADGFTVDWLTANSGVVVNYLCLGGTDLTGVKLKSFTGPGATGNLAVTGVGFKPDGMILLGGTPIAMASRAGIGFVSGTTGRGTLSTGFDAGGTATLGRYLRHDKAWSLVKGSSVFEECDLASFDTDGFTLSYTTEGTSATPMAALCLKGAQFHVGSITQKTSAGTQATTGVGFQPDAILFASVLDTAVTTPDTGRLAAMVGGTDGTHNSVVGLGDFNEGVSFMLRTAAYASYADDATPTLQAAASISSLDADGFTLNYSTADATAREIVYMAIGPAAAGGTLHTISLLATTTIAAAITKLASRGVSTSSTQTPKLTRSVSRALAASSAQAVTVRRTPTRVVQAASVTVAAILRAPARILTVSSTGHATVTTLKVKLVTLAVASAGAAKLVRSVSRLLAAASAGAATIRRLASKNQTATSAQTVTIAKAPARTFAVGSTAAATITSFKVRLVSIAAATTTAAKILRSPSRTLAVASSAAASLRRDVARMVAVQSAAHPTLARVVSRTLAVSSAASAVVTKTASRVLAVASTGSAFISTATNNIGYGFAVVTAALKWLVRLTGRRTGNVTVSAQRHGEVSLTARVI